MKVAVDIIKFNKFPQTMFSCMDMPKWAYDMSRLSRMMPIIKLYYSILLSQIICHII